jgi:hypothetical protein
MRKRCIMVVFAFLVLGFTSPAKAALFADFWATDTNGGGVTLDFSMFTAPATLYFSTDQTNWVQLFDASGNFSMLTASLTLLHTTHLYLMLEPQPSGGLGGPVVPEPTLTYSGSDGHNGFNSLSILWGNGNSPFSLNFITPKGGDKVAAAVPIPPAALLFSTGLIGFIVLRRKSSAKNLVGL